MSAQQASPPACDHSDFSLSESSRVHACRCGESMYVVCEHCTKTVKSVDFEHHFTHPTAYTLRCVVCTRNFCLECANTHLEKLSMVCFACRAARKPIAEDRAAVGWVVHYQFSYKDRKGDSCAYARFHPMLFETRAATLEHFVDYVPAILTSIVEHDLVSAACDELRRQSALGDFTEQLVVAPGFHIKCIVATPAGPSLSMVVVARTLRNKNALFE